ncbi:MAG TPA: hypothetical protein VGB17_05490, partial [Pyrinomonadaceae bacterium]
MLIFILGLGTLCYALPLYRARAANPTSGTLSPTFTSTNPSNKLDWDGTAPGGSSAVEATCVDGVNCDTFRITASGTTADWVGKLIHVEIHWSSPSTDYDMYIHKCPTAASTNDDCNATAEVTHSGNGTTTFEAADIDVGSNGAGVYTVHVVYFAATAADQYHGTATVIPALAPGAQGAGLTPRFQNYNPPLSFTNIGKGTDAGEPSIGVNWKTNRAMYISNLTTFRVTFDDSCPTTPSALWEDKSAPNSVRSLDPILFTDHGYTPSNPPVGRTFVSQLSGQDSLAAYTDDDGDTWVPSQGGGIPSGVDHQSVGAGPYSKNLEPPHPVYPHAVYYCSQSAVTAFCARSDDGGLTFGPGVPAYNLNQCTNLHGHIKVAPDGTAYLPNRSCGNKQSLVISTDNGVTWSISQVPGTSLSENDPAVSIGRGDVVKDKLGNPIGRVYMAFANNDTAAGVAVSDDRGQSWKNITDVGALAGVKSVAFPTIVAGDDDRAAFAFIGSTTAGTPEPRDFPGVFYLYVGVTYDGGRTWHVTNATPNDPVQRNGIHLGGGSPPHRNLLDFMGIDVDKQGRVLVGYADGCAGPACVQAPQTATGNAYTELASIARQSGGRRLFAANDPTEPTVPGAPFVTVGRDDGVAHVTWSESDNGGTAITGYAILRGTAPGNETLLANVAGNVNKYDDPTADANTTYYYKVTATNSVGTSCGNNEVLSKPMGDSRCTGIIVANDLAGDQKGSPGNMDLDIREVRVADFVEAGVNKVAFKMKVTDLSLLVPNRQWRILWNYPVKAANVADADFTGSYYVGMNTDGTGVPTFEYGTVTTVEAVPANTATPHKYGAADGGSVDQQNGIITIIVSGDKIGDAKAGDVLGGML